MNFDFMDLDMYSKRIGLFYQSKDKISSKFGIFLTIIYIFTSLGLFIFYTSQTIQRTSINVHDSTIYLKESSNLNIEPNMIDENTLESQNNEGNNSFSKYFDFFRPSKEENSTKKDDNLVNKDVILNIIN